MTTCNGCDATWGGLKTAHCSAEHSAAFQLLPVGNGNAKAAANRHAHFDESPVDATRSSVNNLGNLLTAKTIGVQDGCLSPPLRSVLRAMFGSGHRGQVAGLIVGSVPITVMNVLSSDDNPAGNPVLVGFDVLPLADSPTESDIPMTAGVSTRITLGRALTRPQLANIGIAVESLATASVTSPSLSSTIHLGSAIHTDDRHNPILLITTSCHQTFTAISAFDDHRTGSHPLSTRHCQDPATIRLVDVGRPYPCWGRPGADDGEWFGEVA